MGGSQKHRNRKHTDILGAARKTYAKVRSGNWLEAQVVEDLFSNVCFVHDI